MTGHLKSSTGFLQGRVGPLHHPTGQEEGSEAVPLPLTYDPAHTPPLALSSQDSGFSAPKAQLTSLSAGREPPEGPARDRQGPGRPGWGRTSGRASTQGSRPERSRVLPSGRRWGPGRDSDFGETRALGCLEGPLGSPGPAGHQPHSGSRLNDHQCLLLQGQGNRAPGPGAEGESPVPGRAPSELSLGRVPFLASQLRESPEGPGCCFGKGVPSKDRSWLFYQCVFFITGRSGSGAFRFLFSAFHVFWKITTPRD